MDRTARYGPERTGRGAEVTAAAPLVVAASGH